MPSILKSILSGALALWYCSFANSVHYLNEQLQENKYFPFQLQQPRVLVMEYYKDVIWKGMLGFIFFLFGTIAYFKLFPGYQDFSVFFVFSTLSCFWVFISNIYKRRLIINHVKQIYQFYIKGILWHQGPLHQIYVRLVGQRDAYGKLFYSLIINGYRLEVLTLANLLTNYEQIDTIGRRIARHLNINYFDIEDVSQQHVIIHFPPEEEEFLEEEDNNEEPLSA